MDAGVVEFEHVDDHVRRDSKDPVIDLGHEHELSEVQVSVGIEILPKLYVII
jgi:hypothetical protein